MQLWLQLLVWNLQEVVAVAGAAVEEAVAEDGGEVAHPAEKIRLLSKNLIVPYLSS